ncbi:hypothetical protein EOM09_07355 [bacterium]|nr:hypothetical protein [bacterium]
MSPLKKSKKLDFVKKSTYSSLMSLFSQFRYFLRDYRSGLYNNLLADNDSIDNIKHQEKKDIIKNLTFVTKEEQIMPYEKKYFKINEFGDVIAPGSDYNDKPDISNVVEEERTKENKRKNSKTTEATQLELPFDETS